MMVTTTTTMIMIMMTVYLATKYPYGNGTIPLVATDAPAFKPELL